MPPKPSRVTSKPCSSQHHSLWHDVFLSVPVAVEKSPYAPCTLAPWYVRCHCLQAFSNSLSGVAFLAPPLQTLLVCLNAEDRRVRFSMVGECERKPMVSEPARIYPLTFRITLRIHPVSGE
jgi:hypothetical protein